MYRTPEIFYSLRWALLLLALLIEWADARTDVRVKHTFLVQKNEFIFVWVLLDGF
jgi:UDP-N-acetylmuramyl pentapeptide phosphotransferase/UDP-N-acetylglucosamine-1-phosphate transferase